MKSVSDNTVLQKNKQRIAYIDLLKLIAVFIVITLHNGTWHTDFISSGNFANVFQYGIRLVSEGVPLFLLVNGFLLLPRKFQLKKHLIRTLNIFIIIIIWSVIFDLFFSVLEGSTITFNSVLDTVLNTQIGDPRTGVLWFLQSLFVIYLFFPIVKYIYDTNFNLFKYLLLILLISRYTVSLFSIVSGATSNPIFDSLFFVVQQYSLNIGNSIYLIYFMVGGYLFKQKDNLKYAYVLIAAICSFAVSLGVGIFLSNKNGATYTPNYLYSQITLLVILVALFLTCSKIPLKNNTINKILAIFGDNTMGIYLLHRIIIVLLNEYVPVSGGLVVRLFMSVVTLIISCMITLIIRKIPKINYIIKL